MHTSTYRRLWAKTNKHDAQRFHPLWRHLLDVAAVAQALTPRFSSVTPLPDSWILFLVALHDIGKADPIFQIKALELAQPLKDAGLYFPPDAATDTKGFRHEARSAVWLRSFLAERRWERKAIEVVVAAIRGHHGDFGAPEPPDETERVRQAQTWNPLRREIVELVVETLGVTKWAIDKFDDASRVGMLLSGLIVLSDWIAFNETVYRYDDPSFLPETDDQVTYFAAAQKEARHALARLELNADFTEFPVLSVAFDSLFPFKPRRAQKTVEELCQTAQLPPGLALIDAQMWEGKTEAAASPAPLSHQSLRRRWNFKYV